MAILSKVIITKSDVSKKSFKHTKYTISQKRSFWQSKVFIGQILTIFALGALTVLLKITVENTLIAGYRISIILLFSIVT